MTGIKKPEADVTRFHEVARQPVGADLPTQHSPALAALLNFLPKRMPPLSDPRILRVNLMLEEFRETVEAMQKGDRVEVADGLVDLLYVTIGTAVTFGIPLDPVWEEVHRSNMAKFSACSWCDGSGSAPYGVALCDHCQGRGRVAIRNEHGKVVKPEGWTPPDIAGALGVSNG